MVVSVRAPLVLLESIRKSRTITAASLRSADANVWDECRLIPRARRAVAPMRRAVHLDLVRKHGHRKPLIPVHKDEVTTQIVHLVGYSSLAAPRQVALDGPE